MTALLAHGLDFEDMFDLAPVSLWMEDYSALKTQFDQWRAQGVTDLQAFFREHPEQIKLCCRTFRVLHVNQFTLDLFKAPDQATLLSRLDEVLRDDIQDHVETELLALWEGMLSFENHTINYDLEGRKMHVEIHARVLPGYESCWSRVLVSLKDVTQELHSTERLLRSEQYARELFEQSPVSLWVEDFSGVKALMDGLRAQGVTDFAAYLQAHPAFLVECARAIKVLDVNQHSLKMFGAQSKQQLKQGLPKVLCTDAHGSFAQQLLGLWDGHTRQQREVINYNFKGEVLYIQLELTVLSRYSENWSHVLISLVDMTERKRAAATLEYLSQHDVLTQLHNRTFYMAELERLQQFGPWPVAVVVMDMNGLKAVNDAQGHAAGDAMLRQMGALLQQAIRTPNCAVRTGGDEFVLLLPSTDAEAAGRMCACIEALLAQHNAHHPEQPLHVAMGQAVCYQGQSIEAAVHMADTAMYADKTRFYNQQLKAQRLDTGALQT